jgi:hypothetical protein
MLKRIRVENNTVGRMQLEPVVRHIRRLAAYEAAPSQTSQQLLQDFLADRDETAFAALVKRHGPMVMSVCNHVLRQYQDAEDAFQGTFLVLARKAGSIRNGDSLASWLHGVAFHTAMRAKRDLARRRLHERQVKPMSNATLGSQRFRSCKRLWTRKSSVYRKNTALRLCSAVWKTRARLKPPWNLVGQRARFPVGWIRRGSGSAKG